jgi:imidazolonepropionase-like amidohydrolase
MSLRLHSSLLWALLPLAVPASTALAENSLLIEHVMLIDGTGRPPVSDASVLVEGERISRVARGHLDVPAGTRTLDARTRYLIPGLMDVHVHLDGGITVTPEGLSRPDTDRQKGIRALHSYLYDGVTTIFDAGNNPDHIFALRAQERAGKLVAPRIFATGSLVTYPGSHGASEAAALIDDWPAGIPVLQAHAARQPDMVKLTYEARGWGARPLIPMLPLDLMQKIVEWYNDRGIRVTVHVSGEQQAREAIYAGVDSLAHPVIQGPITDQFASMLGAKGTPMATTLTIGDNYSRLVEHPEYLDQPLYRAVLDAAEITRLKTQVRKQWQESAWTHWMKVMTPIAQQNVRKIHEAGGVLALGTDQTIGPAVHRELQLLVAAGIPPLQVLRIATLNSATFLGRARDLGSIEEGKIADLVLLEADPTADIGNAARIVEVIKAGRIIERSALDLPVNRR